MAKVAKKRAKVNKSEAVREALKQYPEKGPTEIAAMLAEKGIKVSAQLVSTIKSKAKGAKPGKRGRKPAALKKFESTAHDALDSEFDFVYRVGGILNAEQLINKLKTFKERF
jgi:hypothetical protein